TAGNPYNVTSEAGVAGNTSSARSLTMNIDLSNVAAVLVVISPLALLLVRLFAVPDGVSLDDVIPPLQELEWPRGVQEEEPVRWRVELLGAARAGGVPPHPP